MTCIVGIVEKKKVIIGGDSAAMSDISVTTRRDVKVFKKGAFVFGCTSSYRMIQLIQYSFIPPKINKELHEYMCTSFVDELKRCFEKGGYLQKYTDGDEKGGTFLVGVKGRLFKIQDDFQVSENADGVDACGCGEPYALGHLFATKTGDAASRALFALRCAEYYCIGVRGPFVIVST